MAVALAYFHVHGLTSFAGKVFWANFFMPACRTLGRGISVTWPTVDEKWRVFLVWSFYSHSQPWLRPAYLKVASKRRFCSRISLNLRRLSRCFSSLIHFYLSVKRMGFVAEGLFFGRAWDYGAICIAKVLQLMDIDSDCRSDPFPSVKNDFFLPALFQSVKLKGWSIIFWQYDCLRWWSLQSGMSFVSEMVVLLFACKPLWRQISPRKVLYY